MPVSVIGKILRNGLSQIIICWGNYVTWGESCFEFNRIVILKETQLSNSFAAFSCLLSKAKDDNFIDENSHTKDEKM